jgi:hypothetical protein
MVRKLETTTVIGATATQVIGGEEATPRRSPQAELPQSAGFASGAPQGRVPAEKSVRPYQLLGAKVGEVDKDTLAALYRSIWAALDTGKMNDLNGQLAQDIGYTAVPVTVMMGDAIQATALLSEGRDHFLIRFYEENDPHKIGTGLAGPFPIVAVHQPPPVDAKTLAKLYQVMNAAAARGEMNALDGQLMQDIGYTKLEVSVPLGEEPVSATALLASPGRDHFFVRFYEDDDPHKIGTGLAGPFYLE